MSTAETLDDRILQFKMLQLPGQPRMMHMGTSYLISDMEKEIKLLRTAIARYGDRSRMGTVEPSDLQQAIDRAIAEPS